MLAEKFGALTSVVVRLHAAELRIAFSQLNCLDAKLRKKFREVRASLSNELIRKKITIAVDDAERRRLVQNGIHVGMIENFRTRIKLLRGGSICGIGRGFL